MIRRAELSDAAAIAAIWNPIIRDTTITFTTVEKTVPDLETLIETHPVWLTQDQTGFALHAPFRGGPGYVHTREHTIHLAPAARGQGLGRALLDALQTHARDHGHHSLIAGISGGNIGALAFHSALGFTQCGHIPQAGWKCDTWHDLVLLQKFL